jgi:hypothetical protein
MPEGEETKMPKKGELTKVYDYLQLQALKSGSGNSSAQHFAQKITEAKKDIHEKLSKISIVNPILVDDLIELRRTVKKYFGETK